MHHKEGDISDITETESANSRDKNPDVSSSIKEGPFCHCDMCGRKYKMILDLTAHIKHHLGVQLSCEVCEHFFDTKKEFEKHTLTHIANSESLANFNKDGSSTPCNDITYHKCHICSESFRTDSELHLHSLKHPLGITLKCRFCGMAHTKQWNVKLHETDCLKNKFRNKNFPYLLDHLYARRSDLSRHIRSLHNNEDNRQHVGKTSVCIDKVNNIPCSAFGVERITKPTCMLKCSHCDCQSKNHSEAIGHFLREHYSKNMIFTERPLSGNSISDLFEDQRLRLRDKMFFHCDLCGQTFKLMPDLTAHIKNHLKIPFYCEICKCVFSSKEEYKWHMLTHGENKFSCRRCGDVFETLMELESHRLTAHGQGTHHRSKARLYPCHKCGKFIRKGSLLQHIKAHAKEKRKDPYICYICGTKYLTKLYYKNHLREHNGLKRLTCSVCNKVFMTEENLNSHILTHPAVPRPYKCRYCDATYKKENHRKMHENTRHIRNYSKKCSDCGKLFLDTRRLKVHSVVHTKQRRFECKVCGMKFTQTSSLARHKKIHTEDKKHECTECNLKFLQKYALTRHMLVHSGEKPHKCDRCPQSFRQIFMLTQHIRKHHGSAEPQSKDNKKWAAT